MKKLIKNITLILSTVRLLPHLCLYLTLPKNHALHADIKRWASIVFAQSNSQSNAGNFIHLMTSFEEFRSLFYYRIGAIAKLFSWLCKPLPTLYIHCADIGPGLFIQHGFATIIAAKSIGENCWINQQVTIGYSNASGAPVIGNNVSISSGAKVLGGITVGDNCRVGANAVVIKNVPENCTVVGVPAGIVKQNGVKVKKAL